MAAVSLREKIASDLRLRVRDLGPGARIGPLPGLCKQYGVATETIRAALRILVEEGLIETIPGKGSFTKASASDGPGASSADHGHRLADLERRMAQVENQVTDLRAANRIERVPGGGEVRAQ